MSGDYVCDMCHKRHRKPTSYEPYIHTAEEMESVMNARRETFNCNVHPDSWHLTAEDGSKSCGRCWADSQEKK